MPTYLSLGKFTQQGIQTLADSPMRLEAAKQGMRELGGELSRSTSMGQWDMAFIGTRLRVVAQ